jgi:hypothetical protein
MYKYYMVSRAEQLLGREQYNVRAANDGGVLRNSRKAAPRASKDKDGAEFGIA